MPTNVVVLGGGTFQVSLIKHLKHYGFKVHVITNRPNDPGYWEATETYPLDYNDVDAVLKICQKIKTAQIFSAASEASLYSQSYLQQALGLKSNSLAFVRLFINKRHYKEQLQNKLPEAIPNFIIFHNIERLKQFYDQHRKTGVIIKPVEGSGSKNVVLIQSDEQLNNFTPPEFCPIYIAEMYIQGEEYGGDMLVHDKQILFYWPTVKNVNPDLVPTSHLILRQLQPVQVLLMPFLQKIVNVLDLHDGVYNIDIIVKDHKPYLIDIGPRIGGNCIPDLVLLSFKINEWLFMIELLTEGTITPVKPFWQKPHGVYIIHSQKKGVLSGSSSGAPSFIQKVIEVFWRVKPGDTVEEFTEGGKHLGYVIYKADSDEELLHLQTRIESHQWFTLR